MKKSAAEELVAILEMFHTATEIVSGENTQPLELYILYYIILSHILNEIRRYDAENPESLDVAESLKWWKSERAAITILIPASETNVNTLYITASSVPSERLFSSAGNLINEKRSCLSSENVDYLSF